ncbi:hypothetical protein K503DRAFT_863294 [Rhizopogon vinicolor AM-OR11-026]|uniref:MYND-type domain-containing protein n=1 Tax=Rhizopogon vinicolor AM-OR11-026 TaxID=1314800 RepID=A0A1B7NBB8_9AGAM|nr:hypothetical protein K503DRAFT_863294 [Rhizopogon vinicolor AM-OR11-026]
MSTNQLEVKSILDDLGKGSVDSVAQATVFALRDTSTFSQVYKITIALYGVLDTVHLQQAKSGLIAQPVQQALALRSLASFVPAWLSRSLYSARLLNTLSTRWPILREWLFFFAADHVYKESIELNMRILAKRAIVDFLALCAHTKLQDLYSTVISSPGIISMMFSLWDLETRDRRFSNCVQDDDVPGPPPYFRISAMLDSCMSTFSKEENWNWPEIMRPFNNDAARMAATALDHLEQDLAEVPIDYDAIIWDTHLITSLSINDTIRIPMLMQHSMQKVTGMIAAMVSQRPPVKKRHLVARAISYACWYIRAYVEDTDGLPWICEVVEAGLLPALLEVEPWLSYLENDNEEDWEPLRLLLSNILPKFTIFRSVLKVMGRSVKAINAAEKVDKLEMDGPLYKYWTTLERLLMFRLDLLETDDVDETHVDSCQSSKCNKSGPAGTFKRCAGCLHVHYCSRECQTYDWKQGGHQTYCRGIQARRAKGIMSRIPTRDLRFLDRIIASDLSLNNERISNTAEKLAPEAAVVEIDYTCIPFRIGVGSIDSLAGPDTCPCDTLMHQKWETMVELARNSKTPGQKLLIRAYIPCGTAPKAKLQVIPIKRILPGYDPSQDCDPAEAGDTFDHLYSFAGHPFTIIDQSFPGMKLRNNEMDALTIEEKENKLIHAA